MAARKEDRIGRGRLSSIDLLPEEADEDVAWALEQLRARDLPQNTILTARSPSASLAAQVAAEEAAKEAAKEAAPATPPPNAAPAASD